jgi:hypothetical protein
MKYMLCIMLSLALLGWQGPAQAQHCSDAKGFSTDPDNPVNPEGDCGILNTFDWRKPTYTVLTETGVPFQAPSPFLTHTHFINFALSSYLDYEPGDGWELIKAGEEDLPSPQGNYAYLILYNKYGSFLRIFFTLNPTQAGQATNVELGFDPPGLTGLLHPTRGINQPLDQLSEWKTTATVRSNNEFGHFIYVDVPVEYDPCTCASASNLTIGFEEVTNQRIDLVGRFWSLNRTLAEINQSNIDIFDDDYLFNVLQASSPGEVLGTQTFANMEALLGYHKQLKDEHAELKALEEKHDKIKAFEDAIKLVSVVAGPLLGQISILDSATILGVSGVDLSGKDVISGLLAGFNFYSSRFKNDKKLSAAASKLERVGGSSISNGEMAFWGNLQTASLSIGGTPLFKVPGSAETDICGYQNPNDSINRVNSYPRYNEILGRFAVLETPQIKGINHFIQPPQLVFSTYQFDPSSLKHLFNPAVVDQEATEIWAAIEYFGPDIIADNLAEIYATGSRDTVVWQTPFMPLDCLGEFAASFSSVIGAPIRLPEGAILKLFVDFQFLDGGRSLQVYSYPVEIIHLDEEDITLPESPIPFFGAGTPIYANTLTLATTHFTSDQFIFAWSSITIAGDLTAEPGVKVEILAPDIQVLDESFIGSDIWLRDGYVPFASCEPLGEYPSSLLAAYCGGTKYKANQSLAPPPGEEALAQPPAPVPPAPGPSLAALQVEAYPNPLSGYATLRLLLPEEGAVSASLSDLQGRPLRQVLPAGYLPAGEHLFDLPAHDLAPGMYLLTVQTAQGRQSIKLVKR